MSNRIGKRRITCRQIIKWSKLLFSEMCVFFSGLLNQSSLPNHSNSNHPSGGNQPLNGMVHSTNGSTPGGGNHLPPPPGFIQHNPSPHMNSFGSKILPFLNMSSNNQQVQNNSNGWSNNFNESQLKGNYISCRSI